MLALLLLVHAAFRPVLFGDAPIQRELLLGESIERKRRGIERTLLADRSPIGEWFNGKEREQVEEAIWLSPELISRWLGWQQSREGWSPTEVQKRWNVARDRFNGKMTFVVRLTAFPKVDPLEGAGEPARLVDDLSDARGAVTYDGPKKSPHQHAATQNLLLQRLTENTPQEVLSAKWQSLPPFDDVLNGTFSASGSDTIDPNLDFGLGDYSGALWLEQCDIPSDLYGRKNFDLQIVTAHKKRVAHFSLLRPKHEKPKVFRLHF